ncbi:MAG: ATP-binding cassette domain-containing protein, partial [Microbacteriaceae bacterium]
MSYGARPILDGVSVTVTAGQRLGLIGENGAGKSTLLRLLAGVETPDDGVVERPERTGLLWQEVQTAPDAVLGDIVEHALVEHRAIERELEEAASALGSDAAADTRYAIALAEAERADVWSLDARRDEVLAGLGVGDLPLDRPVAQVSGGQRSRVAMAALLLAQPDALLLDEPTNHLDDAAVAFLVSKLRQWRGVIVFASHDRAFLDDVATDLLDIDPSRDGVTRYGGGYSAYLVEKAAERRRWEQRVADEEQELARLEHAAEHVAPAINHARAISDNNKMAFGRRGDRVQQQISRRVQNAQARIADLEQSRAAAPPPVLRFAGIPTGSQVLDTDEPLVTVEGARVGDRLRVDEFALQPDARWLVTGPNGAGKSTLLGVLAGALAV